MDLGLQGKVAVVTAATANIGRAVALDLAAEGVQLVAVGRDAQAGAALVAAAQERGAGAAVFVAADRELLLTLALGLLAGGAAGNAVDRAAYGAVFDFVQLHAAGYSWYVFNIADIGIVAGVVGLLYDSLVLDPRRARRSRDAGYGQAVTGKPD